MPRVRSGTANNRMIPHDTARLTINDIARRLHIGKMTVYEMLEKGQIPGIRVGKRWLVTRAAYQKWEERCGFERESGNRRGDSGLRHPATPADTHGNGI